MQHGNTTVYEHSVNVASLSYAFVKKVHLMVNEDALIYGALLHDYFLYDWHEKDKEVTPIQYERMGVLKF